MILAVMNKVEGAADMLTGEQIELDAGQLCLGFETTDKKKRNNMLMTALHEEACKTHHKIIFLLYSIDIYTLVHNNLVYYLVI